MAQFDVFVCPVCAGPTSVVNSRLDKVQGFVTTRRRRECQTCLHRYSTLEITEELCRLADLAELIRELNSG